MKRLITSIITVALLGGGAYFYFTNISHTAIGNILKDPRRYEGKDITIAGEVPDTTSLFFVKYFTLKDKSGEIVVVTKRALPSVGSKVRVKGRVEEAFSLGSEQMLVFIEGENTEKQ